MLPVSARLDASTPFDEDPQRRAVIGGGQVGPGASVDSALVPRVSNSRVVKACALGRLVSVLE